MKDSLLYLTDILESIDVIHAHVSGLNREQFNDNLIVQDAVIRRLAIIGEAVNKLPSELTVQYPEIPWRDIVSMRNFLIHQYNGVEMEFVWEVLAKQLNDLARVVKEMSAKINLDQ